MKDSLSLLFSSLSCPLSSQEYDGPHLNNLQGNGNLDHDNEIENDNKSDMKLCEESESVKKITRMSDVTAMVAYYIIIYFTVYLVCSWYIGVTLVIRYSNWKNTQQLIFNFSSVTIFVTNMLSVNYYQIIYHHLPREVKTIKDKPVPMPGPQGLVAHARNVSLCACVPEKHRDA